MPASRLPLWLDRFLTLMRSSIVGVLATASDMGTLLLLHHVFGVHERIANIPSLLPGLVVMFFGNKYFAFQDKSKQYVKQGSLFLVIEAGAFLLNIVLFDLIVTYTHLHEMMAHGVGTALGYLGITVPALELMLARMVGTFIAYWGFSFPLWSLFVFQRPQAAERIPIREDGQAPRIPAPQSNHIEERREEPRIQADTSSFKEF